MIENDNYSPTEIANAIFYSNDTNNRIETGYGTKSWNGLLDMIERARQGFANLGGIGKMAKGGAMEHMVFKGDKVLSTYRNMVIVESDGGVIQVIDFRRDPIARRMIVELITGKNTLASAKEFIDTDPSFKTSTMAMGGSLQGHGLEVGDLIVEDLGGYIKVMSEDGKEYFIKLRDGDRLTEPPLPFERGGEVKIGDIARLAAKYNKTGQEVTNAISKGADVEVEHTEDRKKAMRIAVDHLEEDFYYYTKLKAVEGEVDLTEFYEGGGNVPKVFDVPAQFLDSEGKRKNDKKTIKELTDFVLGLPQTKSIYYNDNLGGYTPSRKKLHAEIINKFKKEVVCINNDKPIAIFMGGSPASGKSSFLRKYSPFLLKEEILKIDADEIRAMLPEYEGWNATQTHLETKDIVNTLLSNKNIGIPCDFDIIYDGTMNSVKSYIPLMDILRKRGYKIFIVFMDNVPKDVIIKRALDRYKKSGRFVPLEVIEDFFSKGKSAFNELKKDVDGYMRIDGSSQDYKVLEEGGMKLPRDREYSKLGTKIKASDIPVSYKKGGLSKLY
jgi:predicted ABC-type ATPase